MKLALSGSGGTGKTVTALEIAAMSGHRYIRSQARVVFKRHSAVSIEIDQNQDPNTFMKVQNEILEEQIKVEEAASAIDDKWIAERTVLDSAAYFMYWASALPIKGGRWKTVQRTLMNEAQRAVNRALMHVVACPYDAVFVMPQGRFELTGDNYRSSDPAYQKAIELMIRGLTQQRLGYVAHFVPQNVGSPVETAKWIMRQVKLPEIRKPAYIEETAHTMYEAAKRQIYPECVINDRVCKVADGQCSTCGREVPDAHDQG